MTEHQRRLGIALGILTDLCVDYGYCLPRIREFMTAQERDPDGRHAWGCGVLTEPADTARTMEECCTCIELAFAPAPAQGPSIDGTLRGTYVARHDRGQMPDGTPGPCRACGDDNGDSGLCLGPQPAHDDQPRVLEQSRYAASTNPTPEDFAGMQRWLDDALIRCRTDDHARIKFLAADVRILAAARRYVAQKPVACQHRALYTSMVEAIDNVITRLMANNHNHPDSDDLIADLEAAAEIAQSCAAPGEE